MGLKRPRQHWAVTVERNGEMVVTIELNSLSGRDLSPEDEDCIRYCAAQLLAFVGPKRLSQERQRARCPVRSPGGITKDGTLPRGVQCGLDKGHDGDHTILIPTGAPWFGKGKKGQR